MINLETDLTVDFSDLSYEEMYEEIEIIQEYLDELRSNIYEELHENELLRMNSIQNLVNFCQTGK